MKEWLLAQGLNNPFNPGFPQAIRTAAFMEVMNKPAPSVPFDFLSMVLEMRTVARFAHVFRNDPCLNPHGQYVFDSDEQIMIGIITGNGHALDLLRPCVYYHDPRASNFTTDILQALSDCKTVIVDLSSAPQKILRYFATNICTSIFHEQERKFVSNSTNDRYVQIYFEEAHNIFPPASAETQSIYSRFAKEGAKFNIGIVYSTQSPSTVNKDLLAQTENFFIGHLSERRATGLRGMRAADHAKPHTRIPADPDLLSPLCRAGASSPIQRQKPSLQRCEWRQGAWARHGFLKATAAPSTAVTRQVDGA